MDDEKTPLLPATGADELRLIYTAEGATAFPIDDPMVRLVFTYGSFLPENDTYYGTPEEMMRGFIEAVKDAGNAHPELALQYAAWQRDPRQGKGNRSQSPWVIAILASLPPCVEHPRFAELVARCIVRPDDALNIVLAAMNYLATNELPPALKEGIAQGLHQMSDYQLAKYANASISLLPEKRARKSRRALPAPMDRIQQSKALEKIDEQEAPEGARTLRLVDVLGMCKHHLNPRLFALYRYLHAPTRQQAQLLPLLEQHLPLLSKQKYLRANAPYEAGQVSSWVEQALQARMTMEQMFAAIGQRQPLQLLPEKERAQNNGEQGQTRSSTSNQLANLTKAPPAKLKKRASGSNIVSADKKQENIEARRIRSELWKLLLEARVADENDAQKQIPFLGDMAFFRNVRGMYQAGVSIKSLKEEAQRRQFAGLWPFQVLSAATQVERGKKRGGYQADPCPAVMPVFDCIFEKVALTGLPRKDDGSYYRLLGLADVSSSMMVRLGGKEGSATCMDAALAFSVACSFTTRTERFGGLAGSWSNTFNSVIADLQDTPLKIVKKVQKSGGMGGTQIFGSIISLIEWLKRHPQVPRPEVLMVFSDMQFHPAAQPSEYELRLLPKHYRTLIQRPEFVHIPPLAAAIVLYREVLGSDVSVVIWNLASYEGSPAPSGMERLLLLSGFDANSFRIVEQWLQAGSPGSAIPTTAEPAGSGKSGSSFEAVLAALRRY